MSQSLRRIGFFDSVAMTMIRSFDYRGRSTRLEFGCWLGLVPLVLGSVAGLVYFMDGASNGAVAAAFVIASLLLLLIPGLPLTVRRLHDFGRTAAWVLVLPIVGGAVAMVLFLGLFGGVGLLVPVILLIAFGIVPIMLVALCLLPSQAGANAYGPRPANEVPA